MRLRIIGGWSEGFRRRLLLRVILDSCATSGGYVSNLTAGGGRRMECAGERRDGTVTAGGYGGGQTGLLEGDCHNLHRGRYGEG